MPTQLMLVAAGGSAVPSRYEAARRALVEANSVDEVKDLHDQAAAMKEYARRAKDKELIGLATDLQLRAKRKIGQLLKAQGEAGLLSKGASEAGTSRGSAPDPRHPTLAEAGINKRLANSARVEAAKSEDVFEEDAARSVRGEAPAKGVDYAVLADMVSEFSAFTDANEAQTEWGSYNEQILEKLLEVGCLLDAEDPEPEPYPPFRAALNQEIGRREALKELQCTCPACGHVFRP